MTAKANDVLAEFLGLCRLHMSVDDHVKIVEKVQKLLSHTNLHYLASDRFRETVGTLTRCMRSSPEDVFTHIKELTDELRSYRQEKSKRLQKSSSTATQDGNDQDTGATSASSSIHTALVYTDSHNGEGAEAADARLADIRTEIRLSRLKKHLSKLQKGIKALAEKEVNWDESDEDSPYLLESRYKAKAMRVFQEICKLEKRRPVVGREQDKKFRYTGSRYPELNARIEKWVSQRKIFPDYTDVLSLLRSVNEESGLGLTSSQMEDIARDVFTEVGQELQRRRKEDDFYVALCYLEDNQEDPAIHDSELRAQLDENSKVSNARLDQVMQSFVDKQLALKLEPEEVQEENCDLSPVPSPRKEGDEEEDEEDDEEDDEEEGKEDNLPALEDDIPALEDDILEPAPEDNLSESLRTGEDGDKIKGMENREQDTPANVTSEEFTQIKTGGVLKTIPNNEVITIPSDEESPPPSKRLKT